MAGKGSSYLLQVASFKSPADAERLKAQLALYGMSASIQRVNINGKQTYHRVRTGPYRGKEAVNRAKALLSSKGLESIAIKLK
jgi:cell division protein FtsN